MRQAAFEWGVEEQLPLCELKVVPPTKDYGLRWYQEEAKAACEKALHEGLNALLVKATGTGKTRTFGSIAGDWKGSVLVLAHRDELVDQAKKDLEKITGEEVQVEQGPLSSSRDARLVVGSIQSFNPKRLERLGRDRFSLVIVDEVHHAPAKTYRRAIEWFRCPRLGVTATPDRGDGKALGRLFEHVAYEFSIMDGIEQGYLVPIELKVVELTGLDISSVAKTAGDLVAAQLDDEMFKVCGHVVEDILKYEPDRQGIIFMPGVKSAELGCELMNAKLPGSSIFISGETDKDERRQLIADFRKGKYKYLWNCQVATEGFDAPAASLVVMGRPTLSRALFAQMAGRGTRTLPNTVDHIPGKSAAVSRREAISASGKPDMVILDFVGNSGKHSLASVVDILGGSYTDEEKAEAKKKLKEGKGNVQSALEAARQELKRIAASAKVKVESTVRKVDPFSVMHSEMDQQTTGLRVPLTSAQYSYLQQMGLSDDDVRGVSKQEANRLITANKARRARGLATYKQLRALAKFGIASINVSATKAHEALTYLIGAVESGRRPDITHAEGILSRKRDAGDDT